MAKTSNYLETFIFPDIPWQLYPVYSVSGGGDLYNLKNIIYFLQNVYLLLELISFI